MQTQTDETNVNRNTILLQPKRGAHRESHTKTPQTLMLCMHAVLCPGQKQEQGLPSPVSSLAAMRMESHLVSYPMQYRVFPKIQATALLMRGALKLELVHTLYPAQPGQDNLDCRIWN